MYEVERQGVWKLSKPIAYEGMAITFGGTGSGGGLAGVSVISDDNFGATQITRVLNLAARLP